MTQPMHLELSFTGRFEMFVTEDDAPADEKRWQITIENGTMRVDQWNDAKTYTPSGLTIHRVGAEFKRYVPTRIDVEFEQALIDVEHATDGRGRAVRLLPMGVPPTTEQLRRITIDFAESFMKQEPGVMFIELGSDGEIRQSKSAEIAAWRNLALLARATAAALRADDINVDLSTSTYRLP